MIKKQVQTTPHKSDGNYTHTHAYAVQVLYYVSKECKVPLYTHRHKCVDKKVINMYVHSKWEVL